jgi:hypothetical protein
MLVYSPSYWKRFLPTRWVLHHLFKKNSSQQDVFYTIFSGKNSSQQDGFYTVSSVEIPPNKMG